MSRQELITILERNAAMGDHNAKVLLARAKGHPIPLSPKAQARLDECRALWALRVAALNTYQGR